MNRLSKPQEAIFYMSRYSSDSISNIAGDIFFDFHVSVAEAKEALSSFLNKCDTMHTRIEIVDGIPMQKIEMPSDDYVIPICKFYSQEEYLLWAKEEAKRPIDISGQLYRVYIIDISGNIGFYCVLHHIIGDGSSINFWGMYVCRYLQGERDIPIYSYSEYLATEDKYMESSRYSKDKTFWLDEYKKYSINYYSQSEPVTGKSDRKALVIDAELSNNIKVFCEENGFSEYTFFLSALAVYYYRVKQNNEFFIGTPVLNRYSIREENMMGVFVNTVPVGFSVDETDTFIGLCLKTADKVLSAFRHQKYHYTEILKAVSDIEGSSKKMFDVMLSFLNVKILDESYTGWYSNGSQVESLQIHIDDRKSQGCYHVNYDYQIDKFTEADIDLLHQHVCNILLDAIENGNKKLYELNILSADEKRNLNCHNETLFEYSVPDSSTVFSLFEETAVRKFAEECVLTADRRMTYGELLRVSESLDEKIRSITKGSKSVVAVIADRSVEMYAAIYGIIRGGNAYLPISPDYPLDRVKYILKDSNAKLVVAQKKFVHLASGLPCIDMTDFLDNQPNCEKPLPCNARPDDTAYVIYTSGSTGKPKGAKISHRSLVNRILWMQEKYPLADDSVILQKTPYTFDVSVWEIFWWGMCGGSLAVSKPGEHFLPPKILDEVHNRKVTHLHFVPSVFDLFLIYLESHREECVKFTSVKHVLLSGEALAATLVQRFYRLFDYKNVKLHNLYGPTECAIDVTYYDCTPEDEDPIPIGKPIYNTSAYVVDRFMNLLPYNVKGELCIGGVNVGQGYLNNPALTADKFIDNPFGEGKLYKTGDLAYFRDDGQIIYCGRMDNQIKLNGQRVEIGEIEAVIGSTEGVDSAAVCVRKINDRDVLVVFYCGDADEKLIREQCEKSLPAYMVPAFIVKLQEMPLNQSGKLDRKALESVNLNVDAEEKREEPKNETEKVICERFAEILNNRDVDRNSNFFNCGGTSLAMISFLSDDRYSDISASDFIANPTPARLAEFMEKRNSNGFKTVKTLYEIPNSQGGIVLIPFAGGAEESFAELANSILKISQNYSLYYVDYLHNENDCSQVAEELKQLSEKKKVYMYSHCAGSAVALKIIRALENCGFDKVVSGYVAGANIPSEKTSKKNIWNIIPDALLKAILLKAGAPLERISKDKAVNILDHFRKDTDFYTYVFSSDIEKVNCKISCVISKNDIFTRNYKKAEKLWNKRTNNFGQVRFINSNSHYFQSAQCNELAQMLIELIT